MDPLHLLLLIGAGLAGGFLAGLVGVGGGIIYGPVLFFFFRGIGIEDPLLTPLTLGTSLLCVGATALSGAFAQLRAGAIAVRAALITGLMAAVTVWLTGYLITTQPWYDQHAFQLVLGLVLTYVVVRLLLGRASDDPNPLSIDWGRARLDLWRLLVIGAGVGMLVAAAGVGGGVLLVPLYNNWLRLPLKVAMATSLGAIVIVSLSGIATYVVLGLGESVPAGTLGYVDFLRGLLLVAPSLVTAGIGVRVAHRAPVALVRYSFAGLAGIVAVKLLHDALLG